MNGRRGLVGVALILLVCGTVLIFAALDRNSHSASDTLRPFLIVAIPLWTIVIAGARSNASARLTRLRYPRFRC